MKTQQTISQNHLKYFIGKKLQVIVDKKNNNLLFKYWTEFDAPDIDGVVYLENSNAKIGDMLEVEITDSLEYDMVAKLTKKEKGYKRKNWGKISDEKNI